MFVHNTEEVIESDEYGKAVFHAVDDNMDEEDFSYLGNLETDQKSDNTHAINLNTMSNTWHLKTH